MHNNSANLLHSAFKSRPIFELLLLFSRNNKNVAHIDSVHISALTAIDDLYDTIRMLEIPFCIDAK